MKSWLFLILLLAVAPAVDCGSGDNHPRGTEKGPCYPDLTCNAGLTCWSDVCVSAAGAPAPDGGPGIDAAAGGTVDAETGGGSEHAASGDLAASSNDGTGGASSGGDAGGSNRVDLAAATVVTDAHIVIQPNPASFSATVDTTDTVFLTVANTGGSSTGVIQAIVSPAPGPFTAQTDCVALAPLASCHVQVNFSPTTVGSAKALLTVSDGVVEATATLNGTAVSPPYVTLTPLASSFGTVILGQSSTPVTFTLTNSGGTATPVITITSPSTTFVVNSDLCSGTALPPNSACTFAVIFVPTVAAMVSANIVVTLPDGAAGAVAKVTGTATSG